MLIVASAATALTASNAVSPSKADDSSHTIDADAVKPSECAALTLSSRISGSGAIPGTPGNDLITGGSTSDTISGLGGDDCIQASGADDAIDGGPGNDVCIGGSGTDTFIACEAEHQ
jgi:Ca2+-binding RTX toxin-like protein